MDDVRQRHPAMVVVGLVFLAGFLAIAVATVVSVVANPMPEPARLSSLALPADLEVIDAHETCSPDACDGEGAVLRADGLTATTALAAIESSLRNAGWASRHCGELGPCMRWHDLGAELVPWVTVFDQPATAAMRSNIDGMDVDQAGLVYLRVFRCGVVESC